MPIAPDGVTLITLEATRTNEVKTAAILLFRIHLPFLSIHLRVVDEKSNRGKSDWIEGHPFSLDHFSLYGSVCAQGVANMR